MSAKSDSFDLFRAEGDALAEAEAITARLGELPPDLAPAVGDLIQSFRRTVREQRRLVKLSDRQQAQLGAMNQELTRRRAEAEEALARLQDAQGQLVQTEKLASLGALVAGIAHEINTPVGIALSCASHLEDSTRHMRGLFDADDIAVEDLERYMETAADTARLILANCERAAALIRSFKQVAVDRTSAERREFELGGYIRETMASLGPSLRPGGHEVSVSCPDGIVIDGYPGALSQVLTNLVMNSLQHGFETGRRGHISITADRPDAASVRLVYADDGKGIPKEHLGRVFDPFFTTRRGAGGTGLGLHIVYNLVRGTLGGTLAVASQPGRGTTFTVTFPVTAP